MIQGEKSQQLYKLNGRVQVLVKTKKVADGVFQNDLVLTLSSTDTKPLQFDSKEQIGELVQGLDLEDDQLSLIPERED